MMKSKFELEKEINTEEPYTKLDGEYRITLSDVKNYYINGNYLGAGILAMRGDKIIDGRNAQIIFEIYEAPENMVTLFCVLKSVNSLVFENMNIKIQYAGNPSDARICCFINNSFRCCIRNSRIDFISERQINFTAIYNEGKIDTTLQTPADNFIVSGNIIEAITTATELGLPCRMCGIENHLANSISISNNYIFIKNCGEGKKQSAYGIVNSGRYARIENNNIKANGSHNLGAILEAAHACGMLNEVRGEYLVFTGNNCVGEWGGTCIGLKNLAPYAAITGNKILSTHTIKGRTVILEGACSILTGNMITSTARNPHLVEIGASENIISGNYLRGMLDMAFSASGTGIWMAKKQQSDTAISGCNIIGNIISCTRDFGIVLQNSEKNNVENNQFISFYDAEDYVPVLETDSRENHIGRNTFPERYSSGAEALFRNYDEAIRTAE